jgi:hypothetical protein
VGCSCVWVLVCWLLDVLLDVVFRVLVVVVAFCEVDVSWVVLLLATVAGVAFVDVFVDMLLFEIRLLSGDSAGL